MRTKTLSFLFISLSLVSHPVCAMLSSKQYSQLCSPWVVGQEYNEDTAHCIGYMQGLLSGARQAAQMIQKKIQWHAGYGLMAYEREKKNPLKTKSQFEAAIAEAPAIFRNLAELSIENEYTLLGICMPKGKTMGDLIKTSVSYISSHPKLEEKEASEVVIEALQEAYPEKACKPALPKPPAFKAPTTENKGSKQ